MRICVAVLLLLACASLQAARATSHATREEVPGAQVNAEGVHDIKVNEQEGKNNTDGTATAAGKTDELELGAGLETITSTTSNTQAGDGGALPPKDTDSQQPADTMPKTAKAAASTNEQKSASTLDLETEDDEAEYYFEFPADFSVLGNSASLLTGGAGLGIVLVSFVLGKVLRRRFERQKIDRAPRTPGRQQAASANMAAAGANSAPEGSPARSTRAARRRAA